MLAAAALTPVVWLATSRFYWTNYDQPNPGYFFYNLARLWLMVVLLAVFWATGSRLAGSKSSSGHWLDRHAEFALCGAAAWSIGVAGLAAMHLYYLWLILPLVAIGTVLASSDLLRNWQDGQLLPSPVPRRRRLNILFMLGAGLVLLQAIAILLGGAIWGASGGDNDLGNYFPYYDSVLRAHTTVHIPYYVHFFCFKGKRLGVSRQHTVRRSGRVARLLRCDAAGSGADVGHGAALTNNLGDWAPRGRALSALLRRRNGLLQVAHYPQHVHAVADRVDGDEPPVWRGAGGLQHASATAGHRGNHRVVASGQRVARTDVSARDLVHSGLARRNRGKERSRSFTLGGHGHWCDAALQLSLGWTHGACIAARALHGPRTIRGVG